MQLFTHLLSSYLQGMGDFFSALLWGGLGRGLSTLGSCPHYLCYSVRVAISRRRYTQSYGFYLPSSIYYPAAGNAFG